MVIPLSPATRVSTMLSLMICVSISVGVAPMALRMPISVVRSFTVTTMMLLTPMAPDISVPSPMSHTSTLTPMKRLSMSPNIASAFTLITACVSVGLMACACFSICSTLSCTSAMLYPLRAVKHSRSIRLPLL